MAVRPDPMARARRCAARRAAKPRYVAPVPPAPEPVPPGAWLPVLAEILAAHGSSLASWQTWPNAPLAASPRAYAEAVRRGFEAGLAAAGAPPPRTV